MHMPSSHSAAIFFLGMAVGANLVALLGVLWSRE